jgi:hypothetical protein
MDSVKNYGIIAAVVIAVSIVTAVFLRGCDQKITKKYGGTTSITLNEGDKLEMVTWKDDQLWTQTRPRTPTETPVKHEFREHSKYGVLEGKVIITER